MNTWIPQHTQTSIEFLAERRWLHPSELLRRLDNPIGAELLKQAGWTIEELRAVFTKTIKPHSP